MNEDGFLSLIRPLAHDPAARGLADDTAVLGDWVLTHDMIVEGVHYEAGTNGADVAWKLVAVNLSDLAAKGAEPVGVLLGFMLDDDDAFAIDFARGLRDVLAHYGVAILGGDTVRSARPRALGLTAIGRSTQAPARSGAQAGDRLWVTGVIGRTGAGLAGDAAHRDAYLRPVARLAEGRAIAPVATAMMDVSDGLLIDADRMARASGLAVTIDLACVPHVGAVMDAVTAGDDYELLFALPAATPPPVCATCIGSFTSGTGLRLCDGDRAVPVPDRLGWSH